MSGDGVVDLVLDDAREKMEKAVEHCRAEFGSVRTGRATPKLVERLDVEAYGSSMHLQELATFSVPESRQLLITLHDPANIPAVEKAIQMSDLGLTPSNDGRNIRLSFPPLTEERRRDLVRVVNTMFEDGRVSLRNTRRDGRKELEAFEKAGEMSKDDLARAEKDLDKMIADMEASIEEARQRKEAELLEV
jgi:ribosome recycling factor